MSQLRECFEWRVLFKYCESHFTGFPHQDLNFASLFHLNAILRNTEWIIVRKGTLVLIEFSGCLFTQFTLIQWKPVALSSALLNITVTHELC